MSMQYCHKCDRYIDTDYNAEHFEGGTQCKLKLSN